MKVTILEKTSGDWTSQEIDALAVRAQVEVECLGKMPNRIVAMNEPLKGTFKDAIGHSNFTTKSVDIGDRWR